MRRWIGALTVGLLLAVAGCTPPAPSVPPIGPEPAASGDLTVRGCAPVAALLPGSTLDPCGLRIVEAVNSGLVRANPATGQPELELAEAIDSSDSRLFTVRLARGRKFHNGTEVRARNFVAAWNWAAYGPNQMPAQTWFAPIEGAAAMNCPRSGPCSKDGRPTSMTGLRVLDDYTFTIRTTEPMIDLQTRLTHPVFSPLPDAFFAEDEGKDMFGKLPVGAGPFRVASNTQSEVTLENALEYAGPRRSKVAKVIIRRYDQPGRGWDLSKAYNDVVANTLDFTDVIPTDQLVDNVWRTDLADRHSVQQAPTVETVAFVGSDPGLADPRLRRAISMAIDREALARQVFVSTRTPASSWVSAAVPGYRGGACGDLCTYDLVEARRLFEQAGGYSRQFLLTVNGDGGHKPWADSVCNQLKNVLGLDCRVQVLDNQAAVLAALAEGELTGLVRQGWTMEYLSAEAALSAYTSESPRNSVGYRNPAYDAKLAEALAATTLAEANAVYREAELLLRDNPPSVPLWTGATPFGWSNRVTDVRVTPFGGLDLTNVRVR